jgi:hypothetical protein
MSSEGRHFQRSSGQSPPSIQDGQYVLSDRSHILRVLTEGEYLALEQVEARVFAMSMICIYFVPMAYWWFRRNQRPAPTRQSSRPTLVQDSFLHSEMGRSALL